MTTSLIRPVTYNSPLSSTKPRSPVRSQRPAPLSAIEAPNAAGTQLVAADGPRHRPTAASAGGHQDRRLGQTISRQHRRGGKAVRRVGIAEAADRLGAHRLRAVERDLPT